MDIQDTGIRGYLKWLQQDQPGLYKEAAPHIARLLPRAFSNYEQSQAMGALMGFAADDFSTPPLTDIGVDIPSVSTDVANAADSGASSPDIASGIAQIIGSIADAYKTKTTTDTQNKVYQDITQAQLQRAQAGLGPLTISSGQYGIPQISTAAAKQIASGTGLALGALLLVGLLAMAGKRR